MKKIILLAVCTVLATALPEARGQSSSTPIFNLTTASTIYGSNWIALVSAPNTTNGTKKATINQIVAFINSAITNVLGTNLMTTNATEFSVFAGNNGSLLEFYGLKQGTNIVLYRDGSNVVINSSASGGDVTSAQLNTSSNVLFTTITNYDSISSNGLYALILGGGISASSATNISRFFATNSALVTSNQLMDVLAPKNNPTFTGTLTGSDLTLNITGVGNISIAGGTAWEIVAFDGGKNLVAVPGVSSTEAGYLDGATENIQTALTERNTKQHGTAGLTNLAGTGAITNTPNSWFMWTAPGGTNKYFAENRALPVILFSNDFSGLLQNVANQMGDGAYIRVASNPYYTNHYVFSNTVLITNFFVIEGQNNPSTVFRAAPDLAGPMIRLGTNATLPGIPGIARFRKLRFEGDQGATNCVGIQVLKCAEPVFQNCEWTGFKMAGVQYSSTNYIHWAEVDNCWFVQKWPSAQGILIDESPLQSPAQNHLIIRNSIFGIFGGGNAITISNWFPGVEIRNSHFRYSTGTAEDVVQVWAGGGFDFSDNRFQKFANSVYPFAFYDRTALGTGTNYNINLIGNTVDNVGSSATDTLAYVGDYVQGVTDIGNSVGVQLGLAGNNGNINTVTRDGITLKTITASRAVATSASGDVTNSTATITELDYLSGVTSAIQTQLDSKQNGTPTLTNFIAMGITNITSANANTVITTNGGVLVLTTAASGGGGTNFANVNILLGDTNLVLSSGVEKSFRQDTNGSHGINLSLAVPESGYKVRYAVSNAGSSEITITLYTNAVAANMYDNPSMTNVNSITAAAAGKTQWDMTYEGSGIWTVSGLEGPTKNLIFGPGITAVTNGLDVTISASGGVSNPSTLAFGVPYIFDGSVQGWEGMGGFWAVDEEFLGDVNTGTSGNVYLNASITAGGVNLNGGGEIGAPGVFSLVTTNTGDRAGYYMGSGSLNSIRLSNVVVCVVARVQAGQTGGDVETLRIGLLNSLTADGSAGFYLRKTNDVWQGLTSQASTHTSGSGSNVVALEWTWLGAVFDGTNAIFYQGGTDKTMSAFATNSANIPNASQMTPGVIVNRYSGTTTRQTNKIDVLRVGVRRL
mgnify:CR=1 FL=1